MDGVGHFRSDAARAHFLDAYRAALSALPPRESLDVSTSFGAVRVYRFGGGGDGPPVLLLPGRNASTPMWADNLPGVVASRSAYCVDLLGEPGLSVQTVAFGGGEDQARWFDELLAGLDLVSAHLMGVSFGGWTAVNYAVRRPGRVASLALLDPVLTFAPIPLRTMLTVLPMSLPGFPESLQRRIIRWLSGGADVDDTVPVARLIAAGTRDFVLRQPVPKQFSAEQLRTLDVPVLALLAGRSVIHDAARAAATARDLLPHGQIELWPEASHAINGEFPERITERTQRFWNEC